MEKEISMEDFNVLPKKNNDLEIISYIEEMEKTNIKKIQAELKDWIVRNDPLNRIPNNFRCHCGKGKKDITIGMFGNFYCQCGEKHSYYDYE